MAFWEDIGLGALGATGSTIMLGIGAVLTAPVILPVVRPVLKLGVKGVILAYDAVYATAAATGEGLSDLVAEARYEMGKTPAEVIESLEQIPAFDPTTRPGTETRRPVVDPSTPTDPAPHIVRP